MTGQELAHRITALAEDRSIPLASMCAKLGMTVKEHQRLREGAEPRPWQVQAVNNASE